MLCDSSLPFAFSRDLWPPTRRLSLSTQCVQCVELLPACCSCCYPTTKSPPPPSSLPQRRRRSAPFNNPLSHFCVSEGEGERRRKTADFFQSGERSECVSGALLPPGNSGGALGAVLKTGMRLGWGKVGAGVLSLWACLCLLKRSFSL